MLPSSHSGICVSIQIKRLRFVLKHTLGTSNQEIEICLITFLHTSSKLNCLTSLSTLFAPKPFKYRNKKNQRTILPPATMHNKTSTSPTINISPCSESSMPISRRRMFSKVEIILRNQSGRSPTSKSTSCSVGTFLMISAKML